MKGPEAANKLPLGKCVGPMNHTLSEIHDFFESIFCIYHVI